MSEISDNFAEFAKTQISKVEALIALLIEKEVFTNDEWVQELTKQQTFVETFWKHLKSIRTDET